MKIAVLAVILTSASLWAYSHAVQVETGRVVTAAPDGNVVIVNARGSVTAKGWDKSEVSVSGLSEENERSLEIAGDKTTGNVRIVFRGSHHNSSPNLLVRVPEASGVAVKTRTGDIDVSGISGVLLLKSGSGNITVSGDPLEVRAESGSGTVAIGGVTVKAPEVGPKRYHRLLSAILNVDGDLSVRAELDLDTFEDVLELRLFADLAAHLDICGFLETLEHKHGADEMLVRGSFYGPRLGGSRRALNGR